MAHTISITLDWDDARLRDETVNLFTPPHWVIDWGVHAQAGEIPSEWWFKYEDFTIDDTRAVVDVQRTKVLTINDLRRAADTLAGRLGWANVGGVDLASMLLIGDTGTESAAMIIEYALTGDIL